MSKQIIEIDGAFGSGGGQILRTACALSAVTKKPCRVFNIRKSRPKPGLAPQHLLGIQALAQLCNGRLEGDELGSEEIKFYPGEIEAKDLHIKIETAGSITLVLQTLIPPALFCLQPVKIIFKGGATDTFFSPTIDYFQYVFLKILEKMGAKVEVNILRRGYYPGGGANVEVTVFPLIRPAFTEVSADAKALADKSAGKQGYGGQASKLKKISLIERGNLKNILIISGASESLKGKKVAERQIAGLREVLGKFKLPIEEKVEYYQTQSPGSQVCLIGGFENTVIGVDNLGKLGKRAEDVGKEAALELLKEQKSKACLDKHLADQILPYLALASGESQVTVSEITNHCKTNTWVIGKFTQHRNEISGAGFLDNKFEIRDNLISWLPADSTKNILEKDIL